MNVQFINIVCCNYIYNNRSCKFVRITENNKKVDKRKKDLRKEVGMQPNRKIGEKPDEMGRPLKNLRMDASKPTKKAEVKKHQGCRKRGRPQLRWEDCMRRDMRRSGEDERWREGAADRKLCKERTERVAQQYCNCT